MEELKICKKHGETLFKQDKTGRWRCKKCGIEAVQKRRDVLKLKAVEYKGGKCEICGYNKCIDALEFHHLNSEEKDFGIGEKGYTRSWLLIMNELNKCIMVCSNCHREIHSIKNKVVNIYKPKEKPKCLICGEFCNEHKNKFCSNECYKKSLEEKIPNINELIEKFKELKSFVQVGKYYGVSDNTVRKWCRNLNLPLISSNIINFKNGSVAE